MVSALRMYQVEIGASSSSDVRPSSTTTLDAAADNYVKSSTSRSTPTTGSYGRRQAESTHWNDTVTK
jgi:hypothetical protein